MNKALTIIGIILIIGGMVGGVWITIELVIVALLGIALTLIGVVIGSGGSLKRTLGVEPIFFCTNCGSSINKNSKYCPSCGKKL